ncbi:hypothetical protein JZ751_015264 [Albula glossodonta]|uniref:Tetraspanin n=1 Tax=Albula glossodonta TaxID=121402 RepID=A0A8T2NU52_9TELE|nr:hypothetical protein JZ751_015264 [Albula glossodonta]
MALDGCGQLCKCILILLNFVFALVGFAMLGLGLWLRFSSETRGFFDIDLNTQQFVIGVTVLIVLGVILLLAAIFGDYGACNENRVALSVFAVLLGILAGVLIAAGVLAFINSDKVGQQLSEFYSTIYLQYVNKGGSEASLAVTLKLFHNALDCCGMGGTLEPLVRETCPKKGVLDTLFYTKACPGVIQDLFTSNAPVVLGCFLGIAALMICALVCASIMDQQIKKSRQPLPMFYSQPVSY